MDDMNEPLYGWGSKHRPPGSSRAYDRVPPVSIVVGLLFWFCLLLSFCLPLRSDDLNPGPVVFLDVGAKGGGAGIDQVVRLQNQDDVDVADENTALPYPNGEVVITRPEGSTVSGFGEENIRASVADHRIIENTPMGPLPHIGHDGESASRLYARPFQFPDDFWENVATGGAGSQGGYRYIAVVIGGLGIHREITHEVIDRFPGEVTLAFAPYGDDLQSHVGKARIGGHEILLQLPMEPFGYPDHDPGPHTLLTDVHATDNLERLHWLMSRFTGYFGVINYMGGKFFSSPEDRIPVFRELALRGLAFINDASISRTVSDDVMSGMGGETYQADVLLDSSGDAERWRDSLSHLERLAAERGYAMVSATALPEILNVLDAWIRHASERGFVLVPASALVRANSDRNEGLEVR